MIALLTAFVIASSMIAGYTLGRGHERSIQRARNNIRNRYMPRTLPYRGPGPQLPMFPIDRNRR